MARDEYGEIPDPWARSIFGQSSRVATQRQCVGGPMHQKWLPEEQVTAVVEHEDIFHTYKLMRDIQSGVLCYVHIGFHAKAPRGGTCQSDTASLTTRGWSSFTGPSACRT